MPILCAYIVSGSPTCRGDSVLFVNVRRLHPLSSLSRALCSRLSFPLPRSSSVSTSAPCRRRHHHATRSFHLLRTATSSGSAVHVLDVRLWTRSTSWVARTARGSVKATCFIPFLHCGDRDLGDLMPSTRDRPFRSDCRSSREAESERSGALDARGTLAMAPVPPGRLCLQ
jgi:hypothetical protein